MRLLSNFALRLLACWAYSFQSFSALEVLGATKMNQLEVNVRDHIHGQSSVATEYQGWNARIVPLTDATTVSWNASSGQWSSWSIAAGAGGSRAFGGITNLKSGMTLHMLVRQTTSGGNNINWPSAVQWPLDQNPVLSTTSGDRDELSFNCWDGSTLLGSHLKGYRY